MSKVYGFDESGLRRIRDVVRRNERAPTTGAQRRRQVPVVGGGGGKSKKCECPLQWIVMIQQDSEGMPTSGGFSLDLSLPDETFVSITVDFDDNASEISAKLEADSDMLATDETLICQVTGGPLNVAGVVIRNKSLSEKRILEVLASESTLNRGTPYVLPLQILETDA